MDFVFRVNLRAQGGGEDELAYGACEASIHCINIMRTNRSEQDTYPARKALKGKLVTRMQ